MRLPQGPVTGPFQGHGDLPMRKTKQALFVIFTSLQKQVALGTCYIAPDASTTMLSSKAARFFSLADAKTFVDANHIELTAHTYIGVEDFID
jgi:hypothetical protein